MNSDPINSTPPKKLAEFTDEKPYRLIFSLSGADLRKNHIDCALHMMTVDEKLMTEEEATRAMAQLVAYAKMLGLAVYKVETETELKEAQEAMNVRH